MTTGERIQTARKAKKLTQKQLADQLGVVSGTVQQYELGKRQPRIEQLQRIASVLGVSVEYLMGSTYVQSIDPDLRMICEYTGLSEDAISYLHKLASFHESYDSRKEVLSSLLERKSFDMMLALCCQYVNLMKSEPHLRYQTTAEYDAMSKALKQHGFVISLPDEQANALFCERITNLLRTLLDDIARPNDIYMNIDDFLDNKAKAAFDAANIESGEGDQAH